MDVISESKCLTIPCREEHSETLASNEEDERIRWFWTVVKSWPLEYRRALFRYITGFKRVPTTDTFKVLRTSPGSNAFSHFSVRALQECAVLRKDEVALVHVLLVPNFRTYEELEENLLHTICNSEPVRDYRNSLYLLVNVIHAVARNLILLKVLPKLSSDNLLKCGKTFPGFAIVSNISLWYKPSCLLIYWEFKER
jgi:diadenosine tetraphosphate (Ap4A) HIT family hydrolase